ncbi:MAG: rod shape-determining protein MreC, partial [Candidatus Omnitrophica bacterium]|nr:rod shape-determining protein MreC [Candidatus Omnitrophota bacterium]
AVIFYHRNFTQREMLKKEVGYLKAKLNTANEISLENQRLRDLLSLKQDSAYKVIASRVIGHSADNWSSVVIIDKGSLRGVKKGDVVITYLGLAGKVMEVSLSTSKVALLNDPSISVSAITQRARQEGLVYGTLRGTLMMKYLTKESDIRVSDLVVTSGLTQTYPKGLIIGNITEIGEELSGLSRYAVIKPAVDLSNIEEVLVIIQ